MLSSPRSAAVHPDGYILVGDGENHRIRKVTLDGVVTTIAGTGTSGSQDGPAASATFNVPFGIAFDAYGNIYVADSNNHKIRKLSPQ